MTNEPMKTDEKYYPVKEATKQAGVDRKTILSAIKFGQLPASQLPTGKGRYGFEYMISETNLIKWMEQRKTRGTKLSGSTSELTIDDLAFAILERVQKAYEDGYKTGVNDTKAKYKELLKELG